MPRWEPGAAQRLQYAAMELFLERGYANVTVTEIAERAGLTKRTFFNYFPDKREILFAGSDEFVATIIKHLSECDPAAPPLDAAVAALTRGGDHLARYADGARMRYDLITATDELHERHLMKMARLTQALGHALTQRGQPERHAWLTAQLAVAAFDTAYADSLVQPRRRFATLMRRAVTDIRALATRSDAD